MLVRWVFLKPGANSAIGGVLKSGVCAPEILAPPKKSFRRATSMGIADLGVILARVVGNSDLDGYLATAPGALYAAVAFSMAAHGNVLFVLGAHRIRLLMMLLIMPPLAQIISTSKIRLNLFPSIRPDGILW